jgi:hypothetical protein
MSDRIEELRKAFEEARTAAADTYAAASAARAAARDEDAYDFFNAAVRVAAAATDAYTAAKALKFALEAAHKEMTDEQS